MIERSTAPTEREEAPVDASYFLQEADTHLEQMCRLQFDMPSTNRRKTAIVATIGRVSQQPETIYKMIAAGMDVARLNLSYESHEFHLRTIELIHQMGLKYSQDVGYQVHVAIALDTKGSEIRTGLLENSAGPMVELKKNDIFRLSINKDLYDKGNRECVYVDYLNIINVVQAGNKIFMDDNAIALVVREVSVDCLICQVEIGGMLGPRKNLKLPGVVTDMPSVTEKDIYDLKFGVDHNIDFVFASYVRNPSAIKQIRHVLGDKGVDIKVLAKVDSTLSLQRLDDIIAAADGIVFDRGDLSIEIPVTKIFLAQKAVVAHCNREGKIVVVGSQVLDSMRKHFTPRRAEVADVVGAVLDGADALMLSSETAVGMYPVEVIAHMDVIMREAEMALWYRSLYEDLLSRNPACLEAAHAIAIAAVESAKKSLASAIVVITTSGRSACLVSRYRPRCSILALTRCLRTARQSNLYRGVTPILYTEQPTDDWHNEVDSRLHFALNIGRKLNVVKTGDPVVVLSPWKEGFGFTNNMRLIYAFFESEPVNCMLKSDARYSTKSVRPTLGIAPKT